MPLGIRESSRVYFKRKDNGQVVCSSCRGFYQTSFGQFELVEDEPNKDLHCSYCLHEIEEDGVEE